MSSASQLPAVGALLSHNRAVSFCCADVAERADKAVPAFRIAIQTVADFGTGSVFLSIDVAILNKTIIDSRTTRTQRTIQSALCSGVEIAVCCRKKMAKLNQRDRSAENARLRLLWLAEN